MGLSELRVRTGIEAISRPIPNLDQLARFLATFQDEPRPEDYWRRRLNFWWNDNPYRPDYLPCGWAAWHEGEVVGFLALLHFEYIFQGQHYAAANAGTWRVLQEHRNMSLPMIINWCRLRNQAILIDTTPSDDVTKLLERFNFSSHTTRHNYFIPLRRRRGGLIDLAYGAASLAAQWTLPKMALDLVRISDAFSVRDECMSSLRLEKRISRAYLQWYCSWPTKRFLGCVDETGALTSYVIVEPTQHGNRRVLLVIDHFTIRSEKAELLALLRHLIVSLKDLSLGEDFDFLVFSTIDDALGSDKPLGAIHRRGSVRHYYQVPKNLVGVPKRCVLAEGDYGC